MNQFRTQKDARVRARGSRARGLALALVALASLLTSMGAQASDVPAILGEGTVRLPNGMFEITLDDGTTLTTHGPDYRDDTSGQPMAVGERAPACATDYYQHFLYARLVTGADRYAQYKPTIQAAVRRMNNLLNIESLASGGSTADYKVLCDGAGEIKVDQFTTAGVEYNTITQSARQAGFNKSNVDYSIFFDGPGGAVCGVGSFNSDESPGAGNANNNGGGYAINYSGCWDDETPMHENGHNQGAVQYNAPYSTGDGAHCYDEDDVMCYSPDGGDRNQTGTINRCTDRQHYDCGWDSYFDSAPEAGEYLATNWNIGSSVNRFITFGGGGGTSNIAPAASFTSPCVGATCSFTDTSTDADGTIASRSWNFGDEVKTGASVSKTYSAAGSYPVTLTVTDNLGATGVTTRSIVPPTTPVITDPAQSATLAAGWITIAGNGPPTGTATVRINGVTTASVAILANGSWSLPRSLTGGTYQVDVRATTGEGSSSWSPLRSFTVLDGPPPPVVTPTIATPEEGASVGGKVTVTGGATGANNVRIVIDGSKFYSATVSGSGTYTREVTLGSGTHSLYVEARTSTGQIQGTSASRTFDVDATPPTAEVGATIAIGAPAVIRGSATDNVTVSAVEVTAYDALNRPTVLSVLLSPDEEPGVFTWEAEAGLLMIGRYRVTAVAVDGVGNRSPLASANIVIL